MSTQRRTRWALALCLTAAAGCQAPQPPPPVAARAPTPRPPSVAPATLRALVTEAFTPVLQPAPGDTVYPGVAIGVLEGTERYVLEIGTIDVAKPGATRTVYSTDHLLFPVASLTKPITGLLLAKLVARGDIDLDDPVIACDRYPGLCPDGRPITWRQLATHTSGLPIVPDDLGELTNSALSAYDADRLEFWLSSAQLSRAPGAGFEYSTTGYAVLGSRLSGRCGVGFTELLQAEVLRPLGMSDARFTVSGDDLSRLAAGHHADGARDPVWSDPQAAGAFAPSGGLIASLSDLLAFLEANLRPDDEWRAPVELALRPHDDIPSYPPSVMALGWQYLTPAEFYWHAGHGSGHHAFMAFHRGGQVGVVVLTNAATSPADTRLAQASFALLGGLLAGGAAEAAATR